jgi:hypothetical protein
MPFMQPHVLPSSCHVLLIALCPSSLTGAAAAPPFDPSKSKPKSQLSTRPLGREEKEKLVA